MASEGETRRQLVDKARAITTRNVRRNEIGKAQEKIEDVPVEIKKIYTKKRPKVLPVTKS